MGFAFCGWDTRHRGASAIFVLFILSTRTQIRRPIYPYSMQKVYIAWMHSYEISEQFRPVLVIVQEVSGSS
ncbi:hypothetical protein BGZ63DRAFT_371123 [Mariannaea sp. PMI_226]|nr:hypothetical protein BGZ63DRAFT_371123 [Mariannaea sp. PMI_226]